MKRNFLSQILARKQQQVAELQRDKANVDALHKRAVAIRRNAAPHRLRGKLAAPCPALKIIAEFKRASPSGGVIQHDVSPGEVAHAYERGGACAISVLTDEEYFGGSIVDLTTARASTRLPVLRKDFIVDPIQIYEAASAGADAILLIVAALDEHSLRKMHNVAEDELGLDALFEVHTSDELRRAVDAGAKIIGVNNRDLHTFEVSLSASERLIAQAPSDVVMISESGLREPEGLRHLRALGFHGFLIGEALMRAENPETALRDLIAQVDERQPTVSRSRSR
jgi:indole-3-glycerol phosphate synthase